ncbi:MAG TPA: hypothetical protein VLI39_04090 [Sedimentisphaerales bacterium]|nr:hypothetical protein [Sedimentisphaerales bacterium]
MSDQRHQAMSRRGFLGGAAAAAFTVVPRSVLGGAGQTPPSERVNVAIIATGSMRSKARADRARTSTTRVR